MKLKKLILRLIELIPVPVSFLLMKLHFNPRLIYGTSYAERYDSLVNQGLELIDENLLLESVNKAVNDVPFYKSKYPNLKVTSFAECESNIGLIDKDLVLKDLEQFVSTKVDLTS